MRRVYRIRERASCGRLARGGLGASPWGRRRYATADDSRNTMLAALTLGEGWHHHHHHHHHDMSTARQGVTWWEVDITYSVIKPLERVGIAWAVRARTRASIPRPASARGVILRTPRTFAPWIRRLCIKTTLRTRHR